MSDPRNVDYKVDGDILTITVDLSKEFGESGSGKNVIVASSGGNKPIKDGIQMGLNIYKRKPKN